MKAINILMTGAGAPGAPGIIKCYRNNGERDCKIIGVDAKKSVPTRMMLDRFEQVPMASDPSFISTILKLALENDVDVIQPLVTRELEVFAKNIDIFKEKGIAVCVNSLDMLEIANDKGKLLSFLNSCGIETPKYYIVNTVEEFKTASRKLGYPEEPICFKPTKGNGSRGFRIIDKSISRYDLLFNSKPNSTYIEYDDAIDIFSEKEKIPELMVMEFMPGEEYSIDMLVKDGKVIFSVPRRRDGMVGGISVDCTVDNIKDVQLYCESVARALKLNGNVGIQVRRDIHGKAKMLEINPRVQGTIVCCAAAGVNLPYYGLKLALDEEIQEKQIAWGTRMIRYWEETYYDINGRPFTY